ncbi:dephospho-CoA kinase [Pedobacter sp. BS3]|uniref:dephospho-CoA kinase n=1 Tax=Pedobacter sp. BS3 TaxID=2567937 RepID=UPI0011EDCE65|nr:dephospho-CoA kinase [Pedobacter sp. BS3]TZF85006.1 dephospho-CoA kinase [Pedobacter sp. BS3]
MLKIGITGGIGSGKSTVSKLFELLGIPVFYADTAAKTVMQTDSILVDAIKTTFGEAAYTNGQLNRKYLANIVFNDEQQLLKLNALVHPAVFRAFDTWVLQQKQAPYVLKEAALLFESGSYKMSDKTILVKAPLSLRISRVMQRDGITQQEVEQRMNKQLSDAGKEKLADYVIQNNETELLIPQVLKLHQTFLTLAAQ